MEREHARRRRFSHDAARWLEADARDVARIEAREHRAPGSVRSIESGTGRWRRSIGRRRAVALARRAAIVALAAACLLQLVALATGHAGPGLWLVPAALIGGLSLVPGSVRGTSLQTAARMLDRDLGLGAGVTTALELEQRVQQPAGLERLALDDGRDALGRSITGARARLHPHHRESTLLAALAAALLTFLVLPAHHGGGTGRAPASSDRGGRARPSSQSSDPTRQQAGPDLRGYGPQQETLPPLTAVGARTRRGGAAGARKGLYGGRAGRRRTGSVQPASRTVGNAGYLQTAKTSSSRSSATSSGAAGHESSTLTTHEAPAATPVSSAGSTSTTPLTGAQQQATGTSSAAGIPGRTKGAGGTNRGGADSSAAGNSKTGAAHQAAPGGATAGATHGTTGAGRGVVPQLGGDRALPIQPGYEAVRGSKGGNGEDTTDANGAGGASHNGHATSGATSGTGANGAAYVPPAGSTVAPDDRRLLHGYFGSYARVSAAGW